MEFRGQSERLKFGVTGQNIACKRDCSIMEASRKTEVCSTEKKFDFGKFTAMVSSNFGL